MVKYINDTILTRSNAMPTVRGVVIHNDAGSMTPEQYIVWLKGRNLELGIAHYYINRNTIARVVDTNKQAWHTASATGNGYFIGYEVVQQFSASDADFRANEDMVFRQCAEDLHHYGLTANRDTVRIHKEFSSTSCPLRSLQLHGGTTNSVKDYFIARIAYFMKLGKTVDEILKAEGGAPVFVAPAVVAPATSVKVATTATKTLSLPADATSWRIYNQNGAYVAGSEIGYLNPSKFGGLTYEIYGNPATDIYLIKTQDFGIVAIYAGAGTGASINGGTTVAQAVASPVVTNGLLYGITSSQSESGTFYPNSTRNIRTAPNTSAEIIGSYENGQSFTYHTKHVGNGYTWLEYTSYSGNRRFVACRTNVNGVKGNLFGYIA